MPFTIERLPGTDVIRARMSALFSARDASDLMQTYRDLLASLGRPARDFMLLIDVTAAPIQHADLVRAMSDFLAEADKKPRRMAFVHGGAVSKMQAQRVSGEDGGRHFDTEQEALNWLTDEREE